MQSFIEACTRAYSFEGFAVHGYLIFVRSSHELYYRHSLIYYAVPYTYISLDSFAAQEINRRARATSNDRLCTRWMCASQIHIYITRIYTYTHATGACWSAIVHGISFNFLFHACLRLDPHRTRLSTENSPCAYRFHCPCQCFDPNSTDAILMSCEILWRRSNPLIGLLKHLYDDSSLILASLRLNYTHVAIVWQLSRSYVENFRDKKNTKPSLLINDLKNVIRKIIPHVHLTINDKYVIIKRVCTHRQYCWSHAT